MYETLEEFTQDAQRCGDDYYRDILTHPKKIEVAYQIYSLVRNGTALNISIVGRESSEGKDSSEDYPNIDRYVKDNFKTLDERSQDVGSVLDTTHWSLLANDAWLLASLHALTEFHFASPLHWANMWDDNKMRITVTAREVIGITSSGYDITRPYPKMEPVAVCHNQRAALTASLLTYKAHLARYQKRDEKDTQAALKDFLATLPNDVQ
jgi:hypothetical protein